MLSVAEKVISTQPLLVSKGVLALLSPTAVKSYRQRSPISATNLLNCRPSERHPYRRILQSCCPPATFSRQFLGVHKFCSARECKVFYPFETRLVSRLPILLATINQAPKPPSPQSRAPQPYLTPFSDTHTTPQPQFNPSQFLKPASTTSFPLDSLHTSQFFERLTFIQHRPRSRF